MEYFAFSKKNFSFIVRAPTLEQLYDRLDTIEQRYPDFARRYILPGYYVAAGESIKAAKISIKNQESNHEYDTAIYGPLHRPPGTP